MPPSDEYKGGDWMLDEILTHLRNYFVSSVERGIFEIKDGVITPFDLPEGQYFRIVGSVFNDGIYHSAEELVNETFNGEIWILAIPRALLMLAEEIKAYDESEMAKPSPYVSEHYFGQYSYTRAVNGDKLPISDWRVVFAKKLDRWRRI
jgi:hypothetical protein